MRQQEARVSVVAARIETLAGHLAGTITGIGAQLDSDANDASRARTKLLIEAAMHDCRVLALEAYGLAQVMCWLEDLAHEHGGFVFLTTNFGTSRQVTGR